MDAGGYAGNAAWSVATPFYGATSVGIASTTIMDATPGVLTNTYPGQEKCCKSPDTEAPLRRRGKLRISVRRSPGGHRVKLVGHDFGELEEMFLPWADKLGKDLRVVVTTGMAPYEFYERPLVDMRVGPNTLVLFLTGDPEYAHDPNKMCEGAAQEPWRVGMDELESRVAPPRINSPEFPSYSNILDDRKLFLGRVEGKYVYTMLYLPLEKKPLHDEKVAEGVVIKDRYTLADAPGLVAPFIDYVLGQYQRIARKYASEIKGEVTDVSFREFCGDSQRKRQKSLNERIKFLTEEIRGIEARLLEKSRSVRDSQKELTLLNSGALDVELAKEARLLLKLVDDGLYEKFKIRHGRIIGLSAPITIAHEKVAYELGKFLVCIKQDGGIELRHETKTGPSHPHLSTSLEHPCLGNMGSDIPKLIGMERYAMVFQIMHEWLMCYNVGSRHNRIEVCVGLEKEAVLPPSPDTPVVYDMPGGPATPVAPGVAPTAWTTVGHTKMQHHVRDEIAKAFGTPREALASDQEAHVDEAEKAMKPALAAMVQRKIMADMTEEEIF